MRNEIDSIAAFVSLPKTWIESCNLRKGDLLSIDMQKDGALEILSQKSHEPQEGDVR